MAERTTSKKHEAFVSEPMGKNKKVEDVAGIGETAKERLNEIGMIYAYNLFVRRLEIVCVCVCACVCVDGWGGGEAMRKKGVGVESGNWGKRERKFGVSGVQGDGVCSKHVCVHVCVCVRVYVCVCGWC